MSSNSDELIAYIKAQIEQATAPLREKIKHLDYQNAALTEQNKTLRIQVESLKLTRARMTESSPKKEEVKIAKPMEFTGDKDSIDIETFLAQINLYLTQFEDTSDARQVALLLSYLKGSAGKWAQPYMWGLEDKEGRAIRELESLRQGSSSIPEYVAAFKQKAAYTHFSDYDLQQLAHVPLKDKSSLKTLIERAVEIGQNFEELDGEKKRSSWWTPKNTKDNAFNSNARAGPSNTDTMDVDSSKQRGTPKPQGKTGSFKCYRCGEEGHIARNCKGGAPKAQVKAMVPAVEESGPPKWFEQWLASKEKKDF
ncbi:hypothetical protein BDR05DRAFT_948692 [Suillus weaverae]|nr:hypothetical protein BDR05DRAFT_948692 [Suillus weaverae]